MGYSATSHEENNPRVGRDWFVIMILFGSPMAAGAGVVLKLGDILVAEPAGIISVIDPSTGAKTVIAQGGLLSSAFKTVGVAFAPDGDVIVVRRDIGLIRVNPVTESQSILSQGGLFRDPWAIAIDKVTGYIYVADSGYDNDRPEINEAGKIIRVDPVSGAQQLIASGSACNFFPANAACQNTTSAGSYLAHPYGIAIDYSTAPATLVVADMSSFNGKGAIIRIQAVPNGAQTLVWGPATASPAPQVAQSSPLGCPMGVAVEPNGNILTTVFTYPVPSTPYCPSSSRDILRMCCAGDLSTGSDEQRSSGREHQRPAVAASSRVCRRRRHSRRCGSRPSSRDRRDLTELSTKLEWCPGGHDRGRLGGVAEHRPRRQLVDSVRPGRGTRAHGVDPLRYNILVPDEGYSMVFRLDADGHFLAPIPLATDVSFAPSIHVITVPPPGPPDPPPARFNGQPAGALPAGTTQTTLGLTTDEAATCRYSTQPGVAYASMTNTFTTTGTTTHSTILSGLTSQSYSFYVRCADALGNANTNDFVIAFSVGSSSATTSTFVGTESVLNEGGMWDSPGAWADLQKDNGAFATGLNAQARLVTPAVGADQYAEITYDQDPGCGQSWVGVATRIQGASNGSGYLAIAYAGEVRLYRTDDAGGLNFTLLASASAAIGTAPRRLRLESEGNTHRVYFNGVLMITHVATGTIYATGQPGIAASVFGGPQVKILSFEGGSLGANPVDTTPPETTITGGPDEVTTATSATFTFTSNEAGSTFECRLDAAAFAACTSPRTLTGLAAGSHTFEVRATDSANNTDPSPASLSWVINQTDTTPPETTITGGPDEVTNATSATFTFTSNEAGSTFQCRLDAAAFAACTSPRTLTGLAAGSHSFEVRAIDSANNTDPSPASLSWVIDQTAPDTVVTSGPPSPTNSTNATFTFTSTEAASTFQCRLDAAAVFTPCSTPMSYSSLASGSHTFRVRAIDAAGNVDGSPAVYTWSIDTTAPNTTITGTPGTASNSTSATFTFSASQANSTFQCSLDGAGFSPCASPVTYSNLTQGSHNFQVQATDPAGNPDPTPASFSWTVDTVVPDTTIGSGPPSLSNSGSATFTFSSNQAGATFQCSLDGGSFTNCTSPRTYSGLLDGLHTFQVRARDAAGNIDQTPASYELDRGPDGAKSRVLTRDHRHRRTSPRRASRSRLTIRPRPCSVASMERRLRRA